MAHANLIIVGAGWFGLTMARTYINLHPSESIFILDTEESVGGVWAESRLYPGLKTNNLLGSYENPDYPMTSNEFGIQSNQHIPGTVVHNYLDRFADHFNIKRLIRFRHKVEMIEEQTGAGRGDWKLTVKRPALTTSSSEVVIFTADKLVIAAGVTAHANLPNIAGRERFDAPVYHAKEFLQRKDLLQTAKRVVVYGAAKSAWDGVYAYASSGVQVDWVIRESGKGPCWMAPAFAANGSRIEDVAVTRLFTLFQPCLWKQRDGLDWLRWLIHRTIIGRIICNMFWSSFEKMILKLNGYDNHPETKKLKPWSSVFWAGTSLSILNYPTNFFDYIRSGQVRVHHADIVSLGDNCTVVLSDGNQLSEVDALHCSTGWKPEPPLNFSPQSLVQQLGIPAQPSDKVPPALQAEAEATVLSHFPILCKRPNVTPKRTVNPKGDLRPEPVPYRLYRYAVPPAFWEKRNIAIIGTILSLGQAVTAQCQSLWVSAYLNNELPSQTGLTKHLKVEQIEWETEVQTRFHRLRTPASTGDKHGEFTFETVPFYDLLLGDLGVKTRRKSSWLKEWREHYGPSDYKGLIDEYEAVSKGRG